MVVLDLQFLVGTTEAAFEFTTHACLSMGRRLGRQRIFSFSSLGSTGHRLHNWAWSNGGTTKIRRIRGCRCRCRHRISLPTSKEQQAHTSSIAIGRYRELCFADGADVPTRLSIFDFAASMKDPYTWRHVNLTPDHVTKERTSNKEQKDESVNHGGDDGGANCPRRRAGTP